MIKTSLPQELFVLVFIYSKEPFQVFTFLSVEDLINTKTKFIIVFVSIKRTPIIAFQSYTIRHRNPIKYNTKNVFSVFLCKGEGYIDICVGILALLTVLVLFLNVYSFLTLKQDMDEITESRRQPQGTASRAYKYPSLQHRS